MHVRRRTSGVAGLSLVLACMLAAGALVHRPHVRVALPAPLAAEPLETRVLSNVKLHDKTVLQSFTYNRADGTWVFAQVMQDGRFGKSTMRHAKAGDLTLTKVSTSGDALGYMYLLGFGHGLSIGIEPSKSGTHLWTEARSRYMRALVSANANGYGTQIARFSWKSGATLRSSSSSVTHYGVNDGKPEQTPYVDAAANRIAVHYYSPGAKTFRWAIYPLDQFKKRRYHAIKRVTWPGDLATITNQGWAYVDDSTFLNFNGNAYSAVNPPPGNATLFTVKTEGHRRSLQRTRLYELERGA